MEKQPQNQLYAGEVPLSPMQQWFIKTHPEPIHQQHLTALYRCEAAIESSLLKNTVQYLLAQHDVLRMRYIDTEQGWVQWCADDIVDDVIGWEDLSDIPEQTRMSVLKARSSSLLAQLDVFKGPVFLVRYLSFGPDVPGYLLMICHRMVVDETSLKLLGEDFTNIYQALSQGEKVTCDVKQDAFRHWANALNDWVQAEAIEPAVAPWLALKGQKQSQEIMGQSEQGSYDGHIATTSITLDESCSQAILHALPDCYHTDAETILLTAILMAFSPLYESEQFYFMLEGDGRKAGRRFSRHFERSVGWFAYQYPVCLPFSREKGMSGLIKAVKEGVKAYPNDGLDYQLYRYRGQDPMLSEHLTLPMPALTIKLLTEPSNHSVGFLKAVDILDKGKQPEYKKYQNLLLSCQKMDDGKLVVRVDYNNQRVKQRFVEQMTQALNTALQQLSTHAETSNEGGHTPSDFSYVSLSQVQVDEMTARRPGLQDLYPLSSMQQSLLFYHWLDSSCGAYVEQIQLSLSGDLNLPDFASAWNAVISEQPMLRTCIFEQGTDDLLQGIVNQCHIDIAECAAPADMADWLLQDRKTPFDLLNPPLMRISWLATEKPVLVWTYPRWLLDTTSATRVLHSVFLRLANSALNILDADESPIFQEYIKWVGPYQSATILPQTPIEAVKLLPVHSHHKIVFEQTNQADDYLAAFMWLLHQYEAKQYLQVDLWESDRGLPLYGVNQGVGVFQQIKSMTLSLPETMVMTEWADTIQQQIQSSCSVVSHSQSTRIGIQYEDAPLSALLGDQGGINIESLTIDSHYQYDVFWHYQKNTETVTLHFNTDVYSREFVDGFEQKIHRFFQDLQANQFDPKRVLFAEKVTDYQAKTLSACKTLDANLYQQLQTVFLTTEQKLLHQQASQIATMLLSKQYQQGDTVAILLEPGHEQLLALLGVIYSGLTWIILPNEATDAIYEQLISEANVVLTFTSQQTHPLLSGVNTTRFCLGLEWSYIERFEADLSQRLVQDQCAWSIDFSGNNTPKMMFISHHDVMTILSECGDHVAPEGVNLFSYGQSCDALLTIINGIFPLLQGYMLKMPCKELSPVACASNDERLEQYLQVAQPPLLYLGGVPTSGSQNSGWYITVLPEFPMGISLTNTDSKVAEEFAEFGSLLPGFELNIGLTAKVPVPENVTSLLWLKKGGEWVNTGQLAALNEQYQPQWKSTGCEVATGGLKEGAWNSHLMLLQHCWQNQMPEIAFEVDAPLSQVARHPLDWYSVFRRWLTAQGNLLTLAEFVGQESILRQAQLVGEKVVSQHTISEVTRAESPLSAVQSRYWFTDAVMGNQAINHYTKVQVKASQLVLMRENLDAQVALQPSLSTCIREEEATITAFLNHSEPFEWLELSEAQSDQLDCWPIQINAEALMQVRVLKGAERAQVAVVVHPMIADKVSFIRICRALFLGELSESADYCGYQAWQDSIQTLAKLNRQVRWDDWQANIAPLEWQNTQPYQLLIKTKKIKVNPVQASIVNQWCEALDIPPATWFTTLYLLTMSQQLHKETICIGLENQLRQHLALEKTLGQCSNVGLLQAECHPGILLADLVSLVQYQMMQQTTQCLSYDGQRQLANVSFAENEFEPFHCLFGFGRYAELQLSEDCSVVEFSATDFVDLTSFAIRVVPTAKTYELVVSYNAELYPEAWVESVVARYQEMISCSNLSHQSTLQEWLGYHVGSADEAVDAAHEKLWHSLQNQALAFCERDVYKPLTGFAQELPVSLDLLSWEHGLTELMQRLPLLTARFCKKSEFSNHANYEIHHGGANWQCEYLDLSNRRVTPVIISKLVEKFSEQVFQFNDETLIRFLLVKVKANATIVVAVAHPSLLSMHGCRQLINAVCHYVLTNSMNGLSAFLTMKSAAPVFDDLATLNYWSSQLSQKELSALHFQVEPSVNKLVKKSKRIDSEQWMKIQQFCERGGIAETVLLQVVTGYLIKLYCAPKHDFCAFRMVKGEAAFDHGVANWLVPILYAQENLQGERLLSDVLQQHHKQQMDSQRYTECLLDSLALSHVFSGDFWVMQFDLHNTQEQILFETAIQPLHDNVVKVIAKAEEPGIALHLEYSSQVFSEVGFLDQFVQLLQNCDWALPMNAWHPYSDNQYQRWTQGALKNRTWVVHDSIPQRLARIAPQYVQRQALALNNEHIDYPFIFSLVGDYVQQLKSDHIGFGQRVGVEITHSADSIAGLLAVMSVGAVCVPILNHLNGYASAALFEKAANLDYCFSSNQDQIAQFNCLTRFPEDVAQHDLSVHVKLDVVPQESVALAFVGQQGHYPVEHEVLHNECLMHVEILQQTLRLHADDVWYWQVTETAGEWVWQTLSAILQGMTLVAPERSGNVAQHCSQESVSIFYGSRAQLIHLYQTAKIDDLKLDCLRLCLQDVDSAFTPWDESLNEHNSAFFALQYAGFYSMPVAISAVDTASEWLESEQILGRPFADLKSYTFTPDFQFPPIGVPGRLWVASPRFSVAHRKTVFETIETPFRELWNKQDANLFKGMIDTGWQVKMLDNGQMQKVAYQPQCEAQEILAPSAELTEQVNLEYSPLEASAADCWLQLVGVTPKPEDHFIHLGGNSVTLLQLIVLLGKRFGVHPSYRDMIDYCVFGAQCEWLSQQLADVSPLMYALIPSIELPKQHGASITQNQHWLWASLYGNRLFNQQWVVVYDDIGDIERFSQVVMGIKKLDPILRSQIHYEHGAVQMVVEPEQGQFVPILDLIDTPVAEQTQALLDMASDYLNMELDQDYDVMLRFNLVQLSETQVALILTYSHCLLDAHSANLLTHAISQQYHDHFQINERVAYYEYAQWQKERLLNGALEYQRAYWKVNLEGVQGLHLAHTKDNPQQSQFMLDSEQCHWQDLTALLPGVERQTILLAVLQTVLSHYCYAEDFATTIVLPDRFRQDIANTLGPVEHRVLMRSKLGSMGTMKQLIEQSHLQTELAEQHKQVPYELVVSDHAGESDVQSYFQSALIFVPELNVSHARLLNAQLDNGLHAVSMTVIERENNHHCQLSTQLPKSLSYLHEAIEGDFQAILGLLAEFLEQPMSQWFGLLSEGAEAVEKAVYEATSAQAFKRIVFTAQKYPEQQALVSEKGVLTYAELMRQVDAIAAVCQAQGVHSGQRVGVCVSGVEGAVVTLALLKLGATQIALPLDSETVVQAVLDQLLIPHIVTMTDYLDQFSDYTGKLLDVAALPPVQAATVVDQSELAAVIKHDLVGSQLVAYEYTLDKLDRLIQQEKQLIAGQLVHVSLCEVIDSLYMLSLLAVLQSGGSMILPSSRSVEYSALKYWCLHHAVSQFWLPDSRAMTAVTQLQSLSVEQVVMTFTPSDIARLSTLPALEQQRWILQYHHVAQYWLTTLEMQQLEALSQGCVGELLEHQQCDTYLRSGQLGKRVIGELVLTSPLQGQQVSKMAAAKMVGYVDEQSALYWREQTLPLSIHAQAATSQWLQDILNLLVSTEQALTLSNWVQLQHQIDALFAVNIPLSSLQHSEDVAAIAWLLQQKLDNLLLPLLQSPSGNIADISVMNDWVREQAQPGCMTSWVTEITLPSDLELPLVEQAVNAVLQQYPMLHSYFQLEEDQLHTFQASKHDFELCSRESIWLTDENVLTLKQQLSETIFDLSKPAVALQSALLNSGKLWIGIAIHPCLANKSSCYLLAENIVKAVVTLSQGVTLPETVFAYHYADYAKLQQFSLRHYSSPHFVEKLSSALQANVLPELPGKSYQSAVLSKMLPNDSLIGLEQACAQHGLTAELLFYSAYVLTLALYAPNDDIAAAITPELQGGDYFKGAVMPIPELFLPVISVGFEQPVGVFLQQVKAEFIAQFSQRFLSVEAKLLGTVYTGLRVNELTPYHFQYRPQGVVAQGVMQWQVTQGSNPFGFSLSIEEKAQQLECVICYNEKIFSQDIATIFSSHYLDVLQSLLCHPEKSLGCLFVSPRSMPTMAATSVESGSLIGRFLQLATKRQDATAIVDAHITLTYRQLLSSVSPIARKLSLQNVKIGDKIAVMVEQGYEWVCASLAIQSLGAIPVLCGRDIPLQKCCQLLLEENIQIVITEQGLPAPFVTVALTDVADHNNPLQVVSAVPEIEYYVLNAAVKHAPTLVPVTQAQIVTAFQDVQAVLPMDHHAVWSVSMTESYSTILWFSWQAFLSGSSLHFGDQKGQIQTYYSDDSEAVLLVSPEQLVAVRESEKMIEGQTFIVWLPESFLFVASYQVGADYAQTLPGIQCQVVHHCGYSVPSGVVGQLQLLQPQNGEATWLTTGSSAAIHGQGKIQFYTRPGDIQVCGLIRFHMEVVENILLAYDGVEEATLYWDEEALSATCLCHPGVAVTEKILLQYLATQVPESIIPERIFVVYPEGGGSGLGSEIADAQPTHNAVVSTVMDNWLQPAGAGMPTNVQSQLLPDWLQMYESQAEYPWVYFPSMTSAAQNQSVSVDITLQGEIAIIRSTIVMVLMQLMKVTQSSVVLAKKAQLYVARMSFKEMKLVPLQNVPSVSLVINELPEHWVVLAESPVQLSDTFVIQYDGETLQLDSPAELISQKTAQWFLSLISAAVSAQVLDDEQAFSAIVWQSLQDEETEWLDARLLSACLDIILPGNEADKLLWQNESLTLKDWQERLPTLLVPKHQQHDSPAALTQAEQYLHQLVCQVTGRQSVSMLQSLPRLGVDSAQLEDLMWCSQQMGYQPMSAYTLMQPCNLRKLSHQLPYHELALLAPAQGMVTSLYQQRLLFQEQIAQVAQENYLAIVQYPIRVDFEQLNAALQSLLVYFPLLKHCYQWQSGQWKNTVVKHQALPVERQQSSEASVQAEIQALVEEERWRAFVPVNQYLFRIVLMTTESADYLVWVVHPLAIDAPALKMAVQLMRHLLEDRDVILSGHTFDDYLAWQAARMSQAYTGPSLSAMTRLPFVLHSQGLDEAAAHRITFRLKTSDNTNVDQAHCLLATLLTISQWVQQPNVGIVLQQSDRVWPQWQTLMAPLLNAMPIEVDFSQRSLSDLLGTISSLCEQPKTLDQSIEAILPELLTDVDGDHLRYCLGFSYEKESQDDVIQWLNRSASENPCGLQLRFISNDDSIICQLLYQHGFLASDMKSFARKLAEGLLSLQQALTVGKVTYQAVADKNTFYGITGKGVTLPRHSLLQAWRAICQKQGDSTLLLEGADPLSYATVDEISTRIASHLLGMGAESSHPVVVCLHDYVGRLMCLLACMKIQVPYCLLNPDDPVARLSQLINEAGSVVMLTEQATLDLIPDISVLPICLDTDQEFLSRNNTIDLPVLDQGVVEVVLASQGRVELQHLAFDQQAIFHWVHAFPAELHSGQSLVLTSADHCGYFSLVSWLAMMNGAELSFELPEDKTKQVSLFVFQHELNDAKKLSQFQSLSLASIYVLVVDFINIDQLLSSLHFECDVILFGGPVESQYLSFYRHIPWGGLATESIKFSLLGNTKLTLNPKDESPLFYLAGGSSAVTEGDEFIVTPYEGKYDDKGIRFIGQSPMIVEQVMGRWHLGELNARAAALPGVEKAWPIKDEDQWQLWVMSDDLDKQRIFSELSEYYPEFLLPKIRIIPTSYDEAVLAEEIALVNQQAMQGGFNQFEPETLLVMQSVVGQIQLADFKRTVAECFGMADILQLTDLLNATFDVDLTAQLLFQQSTVADMCLFVNQTLSAARDSRLGLVDDKDIFPVTLSQQLVLQPALFQAKVSDHATWIYQLKGEVDLAQLVKQVTATIQSVVMLNVTFLLNEQQQNHYLKEQVPTIVKIDFSQHGEEKASAAAHKYIEVENGKVIDLHEDLPYTFTLIRISASQYLLTFKVHKACLDAESVQQVMALIGLGLSKAEGEVAQFESFSSYVMRQAQRLQSRNQSLTKSYWSRIAALPSYQLPIANNASWEESPNITIPSAHIDDLCSVFSVQPKILWMMLWQVVLYWQNGQSEYAMMVQNDDGIQPMVLGPVTLDLSLPADIRLDDTLDVLSAGVKQAWLDHIQYISTPFYQAPPRREGIGTCFSWREGRRDLFFGDGLEVTRCQPFNNFSDPCVQLQIQSSGIGFQYQLRSDCVAEQQLDSWSMQLQQVVTLLRQKQHSLNQWSVNSLVQQLAADYYQFEPVDVFVSSAQQTRLAEDDGKKQPLWQAVFCSVARHFDVSERVQFLSSQHPLLQAKWQAISPNNTLTMLVSSGQVSIHSEHIDFDFHAPFHLPWLEQQMPGWLSEAPHSLLHCVQILHATSPILLLFSPKGWLNHGQLSELLQAIVAQQPEHLTQLPVVKRVCMGEQQAKYLPLWLVRGVQLFSSHYHLSKHQVYRALIMATCQTHQQGACLLTDMSLQRSRPLLGHDWQKQAHVVSLELGTPNLYRVCQQIQYASLPDEFWETPNTLFYRFCQYDAQIEEEARLGYLESQWGHDEQGVTVLVDGTEVQLYWSGFDEHFFEQLLDYASAVFEGDLPEKIRDEIN